MLVLSKEMFLAEMWINEFELSFYSDGHP